MTTALEDLKEARADLKLAREQLAAEKAKPIAEQNPVIVRDGQEEVKAAASALQAMILRYRDAERDVAKASTATPDVVSEEIKSKQLSELQAERKAAAASGDQVAVAAVDAAIALVKAAPAEVTKGEAKNVTVQGEDFQASFAKFLKEEVQVDTPWPTFNKKLKHKLENPELFLYKLQNTVYKFSFLLIPISLPFIWLLLFWKRGVTLYDHAVFALYSLSFMSFLFLALALTSHWVDWSQYSGWIFLAVLCHTYFQFKGAYALGWFSAFWRTTIFVFVFAPITLGLFFTSIIVLGAVG
jgi:hypothetical protein